jgi:di/tricarboxylate transporter|tara:strand:+ start:810 stop:1004 length:195 start_codon:yes stop_codon:yes gene_type:complete
MSSKQDVLDIGRGAFGKKLKKKELKKMKGAFAGAIVGIALAVATRQNLIVFGIGGLLVGRMLMD